MKWEYEITNIYQETTEDIAKTLNMQGQGGWELMFIQDFGTTKIDQVQNAKTPLFALFKRPIL